MTRAERKAGEFLQLIPAWNELQAKPYSKVENGSSEYSDVLAGEFLKRLERANHDRGNQHVAKFQVGIQPSQYSNVLKEYAPNAKQASS